MKWRVPTVACQVDIGAVVNKKPHALKALEEYGARKRRFLDAVKVVDRRSGIKERSHDFLVAVCGGDVKRSPASLILRIDHGSVLDQNFCNIDMVASRS